MNESHSAGANVFRSRNFRLVFFGALVSELGAVLYSFAVSFYILEITDNNAFLQGVYLALCGAVLLLCTPVGGVLGDRYNKARIMFLCDYAKGGLILAATALMLVFPGKGAHLVILFAAGVLGNAVSGIFTPAAGALLPHIVPEDRLQQANAYYSVKSSLQSIFGMVLAGVLYAALPVTALFGVVGLCYLLSGVSEMFIRYEHKAPQERLSLKLMREDLLDGLRYLKTQKPILALMGAVLFINFFFAPVHGNFLPYFVKTDVAAAPSFLFDRFLTPELWTSVFSMLIGLSSLAGSLILSARPQKEKCGRQTALRLCAMAALLIVLTASFHFLVARGASLNAFLVLFSLGCLLTGALLVTVNIPINTTLMRAVEREKLSKVTSILSIISQGLIPIASVLAGAVLQSWGSTVLLAFCSVGFAVTAAAMLRSKEANKL